METVSAIILVACFVQLLQINIGIDDVVKELKKKNNEPQ